MPVAGYRNSSLTVEAHDALGRIARKLQADLGQHVNRSEAILLVEALLTEFDELDPDVKILMRLARQVGLLAD